MTTKPAPTPASPAEVAQRLRQHGSALVSHPAANGTIECTEKAGELMLEAAAIVERFAAAPPAAPPAAAQAEQATLTADLARLTERGATEWAGVDAAALRAGDVAPVAQAERAAPVSLPDHWVTTELRGATGAFQRAAREYAEEYARAAVAAAVAAERERWTATATAALAWMDDAWRKIDGEWGSSGGTPDDDPEIAALRKLLREEPQGRAALPGNGG